jgi:hypothetical protein
MENKSTVARARAPKKSEHFTNPAKGRIEINDRFFKQALRSVGYDAYTAIAELIDNSIDAGATLITIDYESGSSNLVIQDDGRGMSAKQLINAMNLGSEQEYTENQISYFGSGLKTALVNLAGNNKSQVTIETTNESEASMLTWYPLQDFRTYDGPVSSKEASSSRGTKITISNVDRFKAATLKKHLGTMFFPTLQTETLKLRVNDDEIFGIDPLYRDSEKTISNYVIAKVKEHEIRIDVVMLHPEQEKSAWDAGEKSDRGFAYRKGGAYVKYGGRYIEYGGYMGLRTSHPSLNMVRFEFSIPKNLTETFGIKFNKTNGLNLNPKADKNEVLSDLIQKLKTMIAWSSEQRRKLNLGNATEEDQSELKDLAAKLNQAALNARLKKPTATKEKKEKETASKKNDKSTAAEVTSSDVVNEPSAPSGKIRKFEIFDLRFENLGNTAVFWQLGYENDKFIITLNDSHVFYTRYWIDMNETAKTAVSFLLGAIAQAQYDETKENHRINDMDAEMFWEYFWSQVSMKLRHLALVS